MISAIKSVGFIPSDYRNSSLEKNKTDLKTQSNFVDSSKIERY